MFSVPVVSLMLLFHVGHDRRRSGGKPQLFAAKGRNRLLPFQLTAQTDGEDKRSFNRLRGTRRTEGWAGDNRKRVNRTLGQSQLQ